jgi:hypothetical protein
MSAKYNFGGISKRIGQYKVRVGQGDMVTRIKMMQKEEHTEIDLIEFDRKLTKAEACQELLKIERYQKFRDVIEQTYNKKAGSVAPAQPKAVKSAKPVSQPKVVKDPKVTIKQDKKVDDDLVLEELKQLVA